MVFSRVFYGVLAMKRAAANPEGSNKIAKEACTIKNVDLSKGKVDIMLYFLGNDLVHRFSHRE